MDDLRQRAEAHMPSGDSILWVGQPDPKVIFAPSDAFLVPFSVFYLGLVAFVSAPAGFSLRGTGFAAFISVVLLVIGVYYLFGRFIYKAIRKSRTVYAVTTRRALVVVGNSVSDFPLSGQPITKNVSRNGSHVTVLFGPVPTRSFGRMSYANTGLDWLRRDQQIAFFDVADPQPLLAAIERVRATVA